MGSKRYSFRVREGVLYLVYTNDDERGVDWVFEKILMGSSTTLLGKVFTISDGDHLGESEDGVSEGEFPIGKLEDDYYILQPVVLGTQSPVYIHKDVVDELEPEDFFIRQSYFERTAGDGASRGQGWLEKYIPLFPKIEGMIEGGLKLGGEDENSIPIDKFKAAISIFPDREEVRRYIDARVAHIIKEYVLPKKDFASHRDSLIDYRESNFDESGDLTEFAKKYQIEIFETAKEELVRMLAESDAFSEADWQDKIMDIILLLYPKYIHKERNVRVTTDTSHGYLDIAVFDAGGFIDVVEIKKPIVGGVGVLRKTQYRNNYVPSRELSGAIMQVEKYSFWLTRWGKNGEQVLQRKYGPTLPSAIKIRISNPVGMIIFGRDNGFSDVEQQDFEIIKRKYKHVADIITYDDLLRRLENILDVLKR